MTVRTRKLRRRPRAGAVAEVTFGRRRSFRGLCSHGFIAESRCGRYRVRESRIRHLPVVFYAQVYQPATELAGETWAILSKHRTRTRAEQACERHARRSS
jgi:hypothetical protein